MKRSTKVLLWLGLAAIFLIPFLWYHNSNELIMGGDLTFPLNPADYFTSIFHIWRRVYVGGNSAISLTTVPFYAPMALFDALGFSLQTVQKFHFGLWLAAPAIGMFYLAGVLFRDHPKKLVAQILAVTVYIFNTYEVVWADSARMAVWMGLPLMLGFFINGLRDKTRWYYWAAAIALTSVLTSTAAANPPMFLMYAAIFGFWLVYHFLVTPEDRNWQRIQQIILFVIGTGVLSVLINLFWILPYAHVLLGEYSGALKSGLSGIKFQDWLGPVSTNTSILNVFRLQGAWDWYAGWQGEPYVPAAYPYQHHPFYLFWSVLIPLTAFSALLIKDKRIDDRPILFFAFLALVGLLFGAGSHEPTGRIYKWLIDHIQFLSIYRSPWYKFSTWTVMGYSVMTAAVGAYLADKLSQSRKLSLPALPLVSILTATFVIGTVIYSSGLVMGKVFPTKAERTRLNSAHVTFPDYFFSAANWINKQPGDFRILQLPLQEAFNYNWGLGTLMDMSIFTFKQPTIWWPEQTGSGGAKPGAEALAKRAYNDLYSGRYTQVSRLLGLLNVKYALEKTDIDYSFYGTQDSPEFVKNKLAKQGLNLTHTEGPWQFFQVKSEDQRPLFFLTDNFIETSPSEVGLYSAVYSSQYDPRFTYLDADSHSANLALKGGAYIAPDLTQAVNQNGQLVAPLIAPAEKDYILGYQQTEAATVSVDGKPVAVTGAGNVLSQPIHLTAGEHQLSVQAGDAKNLVENPSFEKGLWEAPIDANKTAPGQADIKGELVSNATDGKQAAQITTKNHTAAIRHGIDEFEADRTYLLSFDYKWSYGNPPSYAMWQEGALAKDPEAKLEKNKEWTHFSTIITPRPMMTGGILFLYAENENNVATQVAYDNVRIIKVPKLIDSLGLMAAPTQAQTTSPTITFERKATDNYIVHVRNASKPFLLNFLEGYDSGWQASIDGRTIADIDHLKAYNYANAWYLEKTGDYEVKIAFHPQQTLLGSVILSFIGLIAAGLALWFGRKGKTHAR